jgi:hypothetical protein
VKETEEDPQLYMTMFVVNPVAEVLVADIDRISDVYGVMEYRMMTSAQLIVIL